MEGCDCRELEGLSINVERNKNAYSSVGNDRTDVDPAADRTDAGGAATSRANGTARFVRSTVWYRLLHLRARRLNAASLGINSVPTDGRLMRSLPRGLLWVCRSSFSADSTSQRMRRQRARNGYNAIHLGDGMELHHLCCFFSVSFYNTFLGADRCYPLPIIGKEGKYFVWAKFKAPELET